MQGILKKLSDRMDECYDLREKWIKCDDNKMRDKEECDAKFRRYYYQCLSQVPKGRGLMNPRTYWSGRNESS